MTSGDSSVEWRCDVCFAAENSEALRRSRNCESETNPGAAWAFAPLLRRCPVSQVDAYTMQMLGSWAEWRMTGQTPWGALMDAPSWYVDGLLLMEREARDMEHERAKAAQQTASARPRRRR